MIIIGIIGGQQHRDGGFSWNNPTAVAVVESFHLWPKRELQFVLSVGNGRGYPLAFTPRSPAVKKAAVPVPIDRGRQPSFAETQSTIYGLTFERDTEREREREDSAHAPALPPRSFDFDQLKELESTQSQSQPSDDAKSAQPLFAGLAFDPQRVHARVNLDKIFFIRDKLQGLAGNT